MRELKPIHGTRIKLPWTAQKHGSRYSRMDQVKFVEDSLKNILRSSFLNTLIKMKFFIEDFFRTCEKFRKTSNLLMFN